MVKIIAMTINLLTKSELTAPLQQEIASLFFQLSSTIEQLPLETILADDERLIFAYCTINGKVVGIAAMALYKVISGAKGMIEDVVVDEMHRGKGIGRKMMETLLKEGENRKLNEILLFSGHHRKAAIHLYQSLGFQLKKSGIYNLRFAQ